MISLRFFVPCGVILILSGVAQAFVRPRKKHETGLGRVINRGTVWAVVCVAVGVMGVLVGLGVLPVMSVQR